MPSVAPKSEGAPSNRPRTAGPPPPPPPPAAQKLPARKRGPEIGGEGRQGKQQGKQSKQGKQGGPGKQQGKQEGEQGGRRVAGTKDYKPEDFVTPLPRNPLNPIP